ncbi:MAG: sigma-70 family RNA polymerase sigma factor [Opitutaceae bacterium]|nr:sigma-70 family RNA polymerase sigma factor [Opitutaceae bacterium]
MAEDAELLRQFATSRSEVAFAALVQRHVNGVYGSALRRMAGDPSAAADASQEVFCRLAREAGRLVHHPSLAGWLHTTTRHVAIDMIRSDQRRKVREKEAQTRLGLDLDPSTPESGAALQCLLDPAMDQLGSKEREAVLLRYFEGRSFTEVGRVLGLSEEAARKRVERALARLRAHLEHSGLRSTQAALSAALTAQATLAAPAGFASSVTGLVLSGVGGAGAVSLGAIGFLSLMTTTSKLVFGGALVLAAVGVGSALFSGSRVRAAERRLIESQATVRKLERDLAHLAQPTGARRTTVDTSAFAAPPAAEARAPAASAPAPSETEEAVLDRLVLGLPELQRLYVKQQVIRIAEKFGPLYRTLALSPTQAARFEAILGDYAQMSQDIYVSGLAKGLPKTDPAVRALVKEAADQRDAALRELMGTEGFATYREFDRTSLWRALPARLAGMVYSSDQPLTHEQAERLTAIVSAPDPQVPNRHPFSNERWADTLAQARAVLAPAQVAALEVMREQYKTGLEVHQIVNPVLQAVKPRS